MSHSLLGAKQTAATNPKLEFRDGQFLFTLENPEGGISERLISPEAAREAFTGVPIDSGWLRPEVVRWGNGKLGEWVVAFIPPQIHELELTKEVATDTEWKEFETNLERIRTPLPGLVFFGLSNQYFIFAVKTDRLDPYFEIYRCPLPNVEASGLICWGPFKPPRCTAKTIFEAFELFIKSTFNNHRCDGKSKQHRDDVRIVLRAEAVAHADAASVAIAGELHDLSVRYPVQDLVRQVEHTGITLDQWVKELFSRGKQRDGLVGQLEQMLGTMGIGAEEIEEIANL